MFCKQCGNELTGTGSYCSVCGESTQILRDGSSTTTSYRQTINEGGVDVRGGETYRSFEYTRMNVKADLVQAAIDCYESLGWELTGQRASDLGGQVTLSFRRGRKVRAKAQLSKIQRAMDDALNSIANMEAEKTKKARSQAIAFGVVSSLILGLGMSCTMVWQHLMAIGIVVGIIGIAGCVLTWLIYRKTCAAETARLNPLIEEAYDRLATQCEEAQAVLLAFE